MTVLHNEPKDFVELHADLSEHMTELVRLVLAYYPDDDAKAEQFLIMSALYYDRSLSLGSSTEKWSELLEEAAFHRNKIESKDNE